MATSLENQYIDESYQKLTQISGSILADGTGSVITELVLTSSFATTASYALNSTPQASASYALSASHAVNADTAISASYAANAVWDGQFSGSAGFTGSISFADSSTVGNLGTLVIKGADGFSDDSYIQGVGKYQSDNGETYLVLNDGAINYFVSGGAAAEIEYFVNNSTNLKLTEVGTQFYKNAIFSAGATGSLFGTASYASQAATASYIQGSNVDGEVTLAATASFLLGLIESASYAVNADTATSASFATTASYALNSTPQVSSSYAVSSSQAENANTATSASHAVQADSALSADLASTASYVAGANVDGTVALATSASFATTASYALNVDAANVTGSVTNAEFAEYADNTIVHGKNLSAGTILKGTPLYFTASGVSGNLVGVYPADASIPSRMPAAGIAGQDLTAGAQGRVILDGFINGVDTSAFTSGDTLYVAAGGGYTNSRPTGSTTLVQAIGYVEQSALNGSGVIQGSGRANDVPNIAEGYGWFGNSDGVATAQSTASFAKTDKNNVFSGNQTFNDISVNGTGSFAYIQSVTGSAKIIGDAFIVLNADTPTERYAGLKIYDSGSTPGTASFFFDGLNNDWAYEYTSSGDTLNYGSVLFGPEYSTKGSPVFPTSQSVLLGTGGHHAVASSNIKDLGTEINLVNVPTVSDNNITAVGTITSFAGFSGNLTGNVTGNASTATSATTAVTANTASYILGSNVDGPVADANAATVAASANFVLGSNVSGAVDNAVSASYALTASHALNSVAPFPYTGSADILGNLGVTGNGTFNSTDFEVVTSNNFAVSASAITSFESLVFNFDVNSYANWNGGAVNFNGSYLGITNAGINQTNSGASNTFQGDVSVNGLLEANGGINLGQVNIGAGDVSANTASVDMTLGKQAWINQPPGEVHINLQNGNAGFFMDILLLQSSTGSLWTWPSGMQWEGGSAPSIPVQNYRRDIVRINSFYGGNYNGTYMGQYS